MVFVNQLDVLEANNGMEKPVGAKKVSIGMEQFVYFVSTDKFGMKMLRLASVKLTMNGMETSARRKSPVQEVESGIKSIRSACAQMAKLGTGILALSRNHVAVASSGMTPVYNAIVLMDSTGMVEHAFFAQMEKYGTSLPEVVFVKLELNGTDSSALLFKDVKVDQSGTRILGLANALQALFGTMFIVLLTPVEEARSGIT